MRTPADLDHTAAQWQRALDAAARALAANRAVLPIAEVSREAHHLNDERRATAALLRALAKTNGAPRAPWLAAGPVTPRLLGLRDDVDVCLFDLDGVLIDRDALDPILFAHHVATKQDAPRYLQAACLAGLRSAVVSASATALPRLHAAGLTGLVDECLDASTMRELGLRSRPEPDLLLAACDKLGAKPQHAVSLTHSGPGVVAAQSIDMPVIGVASGAEAEALRACGADEVVPALGSLLDRALRAA